MTAPIVRSVSVGASPSDAFDAFTRVSDLLSWWCEGALVGLRPGGNWAIGFTNQRGGTEATVLGKISEIEPGRRLVVRQISFEPALGEPLEDISIGLTFHPPGRLRGDVDRSFPMQGRSRRYRESRSRVGGASRI